MPPKKQTKKVVKEEDSSEDNTIEFQTKERKLLEEQIIYRYVPGAKAGYTYPYAISNYEWDGDKLIIMFDTSVILPPPALPGEVPSPPRARKKSPAKTPQKKKASVKKQTKKSSKKEPKVLYYELYAYRHRNRDPNDAFWKETIKYLERDLAEYPLKFEITKENSTKYVLKVVKGRRKVETINKIILEEIEAQNNYARKYPLPVRVIGNGIDSGYEE